MLAQEEAVGELELPDNVRYIFADTETTDAEPGYKACEIGWVETDAEFNILNRVESLIDPQRMINPGASGIHGLVNADVENFPTIEEFFSVNDPSCYGTPITGPTVIIGHRIGFDKQLLAPYMPGLLQEVCTLRWARAVYPDSDDHKLTTLGFALGLPRDGKAHRVMADIMLAYHLCKHLCERLGMTLPELTRRSFHPLQVQRMPFGKHKGERIEEVTPSYLRWMLREMDLDMDLRYSIDLALNNKKNKR